MAKKVKDQIVLLVKVPGYQMETTVIIDYDSIWTDLYGNWKFQTWLDWCKQYVNVQGRYRQDGTLGVGHICVAVSNRAETFYRYPSQCKPIRWRMMEYK